MSLTTRDDRHLSVVVARPASTHMPAGESAPAGAPTPDGRVPDANLPGSSLPDGRLPPILAVHGFASSAKAGWGRTGHLDALTRAGRTVIAIDLRGHGRSDKPHDRDAYALDAVLADLLLAAGSAQVPASTPSADGSPSDGSAPAGMTRFSPRPAAGGTATPVPGPVDLLGYSLGARLCWNLACRELLPVRRMVLGGFDGRPLFTNVDTERLDQLAAGVADADREALRCLVAGLSGSGDDAADGAVPGVPTLVVAGGKDPIARDAEKLARMLPHGQFLAVPGRTHISAVPASVFRQGVVDFLGAGMRR